ncbi:hypothetical protein F8M41_005539 [Gigaspora margarita]|uniref:Uncharacterized protein n=1 Tax=Gigaspora margarita TaxID=4874 RepID=A0A8H4A4W5_GIGMA|nr:hypothetical protein F8M41_005539 [Gigaspora margarita]
MEILIDYSCLMVDTSDTHAQKIKHLSINTQIMELFDDTEPIGTATDEAENEESNEHLNDAITEDFHDITYELI